MAKTHYLQSAFTAGVLDPRLASRIDIKQYYEGCSIGRNVVTVPLGGIKRRPGLRFVCELPARLARITGATPTAPEGGTAANANDDDRTTFVTTVNNIGTDNDYVIAQLDLGSARDIVLIEVRDFTLSGAAESTLDFSLQSSLNGSSWSIVGTATQQGLQLVNQTDRSYARHAAGFAPFSARYVRLVKSTSTNLGSVIANISGLNVYEVGDTVSAVRLLPFERADDELYVVCLTDGFATIVRDGEIVTTVPTDYASADLAGIDAAQSADTMVIVHDDYEPLRLLRESATNWQLFTVPFSNIPTVDFDDAASPSYTAEVQTITFTNFVEGNTFQIELEGARSGPIGYAGDGDTAHQNTTAARIQEAIQKLYTVGFSGVSCEYDPSDALFVVTLDGESADAYELLIVTPVTAASNAATTVARVTPGVARREDAWSAERGFPRTVTFHEGRLWLGGTRSLPQAYFGSVVNDFFNFLVGEGLDDDAVFGLLNTDELNQISALQSGRFLHVFTSGGEFRFTASPITPADVPRNQTKYGTAKIRPVSVDGAIVYVQRTRKVLRDFLYRYEEDAYSSVPVSVLASHLLSGVVDATAWQGSDEDDANYVFLVNGDGTIAVYNTLRSQDIAAFTKWDTVGMFKAAASVGDDRYFAVERTVSDVDVLYLEMADDDYFTDSGVQVEGSPPGGGTPSIITGFDHMIGETLRVRADGFVLESVEVNESGNLVLGDYEPQTIVEAGLDFEVDVTTMPLNSDFGNGGNYLRKKRVVKMRCNVYLSLGVRYNGRPLADRFFDQSSFDIAPEPYTGVHSLEESSNWDEGPITQTFSQIDPLPFHLLGVDFTIESAA